MKDWMIRALKTFVQAFFGVLIPAVCTVLNNGWPESWGTAWVILAPTVAAALAAAIAAVWNIILEELDKAYEEKPPDTAEFENNRNAQSIDFIENDFRRHDKD